MDQELKAKWCAALRSGEFKQGRSYMHGGGFFCCLGVLREILAPGARYEDEKTSKLRTEHADGLAIETMSDMASMNDRGKTFPEIAEWIEANLLMARSTERAASGN